MSTEAQDHPNRLNAQKNRALLDPELVEGPALRSLLRSRHLYICREPSTNQLLFMQNKPNLPEGKIDAKCVFTKDYENKWQRRVRKNKPNSNPIKPNLQKAKMNVNSLITKDYRKNDDFSVRKNKPNSNPISERPKINVNLYFIEDYENETAFGPKKTNPNKPNFKCPQSQSRHSALLVRYNCFSPELLIIGSSHDVKLTGAAHTASVFSRWLALSFGCLSFKNFHSLCLKVPVETGHVKTLEEAK